MKKRNILLLIACVFLLIFLTACNKQADTAPEIKDAETQVIGGSSEQQVPPVPVDEADIGSEIGNVDELDESLDEELDINLSSFDDW